jgi:hypothetical protein
LRYPLSLFSFVALNRQKVANPKIFKVSDESLNDYGFRILSAGIRTQSFEANPVGFYNHHREGGVICKWKNLTLRDGAWYAEPEFDTEDELGAKVAGKVERGFIKGASIGVKVLATSEDPAWMLTGQKLPTVTECELVEISIVDLPGNKNALALYDAEGNQIELKSGSDLPLIFSTHHKNVNMLKLTAKTVAALGLSDNATAEQIEAAVAAKDAELEQLRNELKVLRESQDAAKKARIKAILDQAEKDKKIVAAERAEFEAIGELSEDLLAKTLAKLTAPHLPAAGVKPQSPLPSAPAKSLRDQVQGKGLRQLERENSKLVTQIFKEDKELYAELYEAEYGKPYQP